MEGHGYKRIVYAIIESVLYGEREKPIQKVLRRMLRRYGLQGSIHDPKISGIVYNIFRNLGLIDRIIYSATGFDVSELNPIERSILRALTYMLHVDERGASREFLRKMKRYAIRYAEEKMNAIQTDRVKTLINRIALSEWKPRSFDEKIMVEYRISPKLYNVLAKALGELREDIDRFLKFTLTPPPHVFRVNSLKASRENIIELLRSKGVSVEAGKYSPQAIRITGSLKRDVIELVEKGVLVPQDESSMVAIELLNPKEGMDIADLCAAPGGKTTYLAEKTRLKARIHSFEIFEDRARRLKKLLKKTNTDSVVKVYVMDARYADKVLGRESMDQVVIDPPCSSTGALARNPDVRWRYDEDELERINRLQKELLETGWKILKPGGRLLYTTCSVLPSEGEYVIKDFVKKHDDATIIDLNKPFKKSPIFPQTMRAWPHIHNVTGFFYAILEKK